MDGSGTRRRLSVAALTRVEGEGGMKVQIRDGRVEQVNLNIYEPPRFFEALLVGRDYREPPDLTARICGICPVAYQMSACLAIEDACGVVVDGSLAQLRRLLYCGEWISSHALHLHMLHAPDFLGYSGIVDMASDHPEAADRGFQLKRVGNEIMKLLGGRAIHPVNVRLGGFYRLPSRASLEVLAQKLRRARDGAEATVRWVAGFDFPEFEPPQEQVSMSTGDEYPILRGTVISTGGIDVPASQFEQWFTEEQVPHSTALHSRLRGGGHYLMGPVPRYNLNRHLLSPVARQAAQEAGLGEGCRNPFQSIVVRAVEILYACDEALRLIEAYEAPDRPYVDVEPVEATGYAFTEAPRGTLYHRYRIGADGLITQACIVPPTSQNQGQIEDDLRLLVQQRLAMPAVELTQMCERAIRNYDPCISCASHFLRLRLVHR
ncbi:MAG: Ni/Fe hydrogenase subunit alpha [Actinomycetota bacterium]